MKKGSQQQQQQQQQQQNQSPQQYQLSPQSYSQMGPSGEDYLRMDVIHEEDESNAAKLSMMHLDPLTFELTGMVVHDTNLLNQAQTILRQHIETRAIPRQLARYQFEQFKEKLDTFILQQTSVTSANESDMEQVWKVCHDANILQSIMQETYNDATQTEVNIDSRYELQCSQLDFLKKKSSEQIQKRSYTKINQLNPILVPMEIDTSGTQRSMNSQDINNANNSALKVSSGSRFRVPSIAAEAENNQNILQAANMQANDKIANSGKEEGKDDSKILPAAEMQIFSPRLFVSGDASNKPADSTSCGSVSNEHCLYGNNQNLQQVNNTGFLINHPKIFQIKQNSFQSFRISPKEASLGGINANLNVSKLSLADDGQEKPQKILQATPATPEDKTTDLIEGFQQENDAILEDQRTQNILSKSYQLQSHPPCEETQQQTDDNMPKISLKSQQQEEVEKLNEVITAEPIISSQQIVQNLISGLENDFKAIELLFDDKLVDNVEKARLLLKDKIQAAKNTQSEELLRELEQFERKHEKSLKYYEDIYIQLHESLGIVDQKEGWRMEGDKHGFMIQYKYIPNSKLIALRLETTAIDMEIQKLLAIIYEIELYTQWFPFCKYAKNIKTVDKARKVVHVKVDPPFVSDREVFIHGIGIDRLNEDGSIVIMARSIDKDPSCLEDCQVTLPKNIKGVLVDIPFFTFQVKPISKDKLRFTSLTNFDAHLKFIPDSIVNLVTRKFARFLFEKMLDQQKKFKGSKYEQNIKDNPQFYEWIEQKCKIFFEKKQTLSDQMQK